MDHWIDKIPFQKFFEVDDIYGVEKIPLYSDLFFIKSIFFENKFGFDKYQDVILGIDRRWDALMNRRNTNN